jgi:hypothetical protein
MKISWNNSTVVSNRWRCGAVLLASVCIVWVAFISSSAQLKAQKRVTSVEMGQATQGARVSVISDSPLSDYEAFRRGDRFYVKIPLAEFSFSQPRFHGNGFDDVQVQKVGDSVVVSFKLQLGASAHVEQHANRLEVIFTAANRGQYASVASNRSTSVTKDISGTQGNQDRQRDAAGPMPSDVPRVTRERYAAGRGHEVNAAQDQPARIARAQNSRNQTNSINNRRLSSSTPGNIASPTPVPNYPASSSYTPASTPVPSLKPGVVSANSQNSKMRSWFLANRKAALLAALVLVALLALAAAFFYRRRTTKSLETRVNRPLAQPKYDSKMDLDELTASPAEPGPVVAPITQEATKSGWNRAASEPAFAPAAEVAASHAAAFSKQPNSSVAVADNKVGKEEREVFEL